MGQHNVLHLKNWAKGAPRPQEPHSPLDPSPPLAPFLPTIQENKALSWDLSRPQQTFGSPHQDATAS